MDKKELKVHQRCHEAVSKEEKKENELLKAKEDKRQKAWKLAKVLHPTLVEQTAGN